VTQQRPDDTLGLFVSEVRVSPAPTLNTVVVALAAKMARIAIIV